MIHRMNAQKLPFLKLAWRNIWRNKRRAVLTVGALSFFSFFMLWMIWFSFGTHDVMLENFLRVQTGHIQIHARGFNEDMSIMKRIKDPEPILNAVSETKHVTGSGSCIKSQVLALAHGNSGGGFLLAFDPRQEKYVSNLYKSLKSGKYLSDERRGEVVIGYVLAENLNLKLGEQISLLVQAVDGSMGAQKYTVVGLVDPGTPELNNALVMMNLADAQELLVYGHSVSEILVMVDDFANVDEVTTALKKKVDTGTYEVLAWYDASALAKQSIDMAWAGFMVTMLVFGVIIILGIMNSLLMSAMERVKEFGMMMAMGIRPRQITRLMVTESMLITLVSIIIGFSLALVVSLINTQYGLNVSVFGGSQMLKQWGEADVVFFSKLNWDGFWISLGSVVIMAFVSSLYPAIHTARLKPVEAMKFE
jgi:putative ABC transport system permease protein